MTLKINNRSLSALFRASERRTNWLDKLRKNCSGSLNRLGNLLTMTPASLTAPKDGKPNRITLVYIGEAKDAETFAAKDLQRINAVLQTAFTPTSLGGTVKFSRINVALTINLPFKVSASAELAKAA